MKVKPKLYLNGSPQTAEEGSLAFARNMKIDNDGNLVSDYGYENIESLKDYNIVGHIVGLDNKVYLFTENKIIEYDEINNIVNELSTGWKYNGGEISGYVSTNISGEKILTIAEYKNGIDIPLKHINLNYCSEKDNESLYCQAPICPTANLILNTTYVKTIPNGVYIFFIRYKIRKDVYTNWFLCSRPIYAGVSEKISTIQGGLKYINLHKDSAKSFILDLDFAQEENKQAYKEFQLGFIITHDEATDARTWKHFDIDTKTIYFDYENVEEANIDDLLKTTYELYNIKNVTAFKNKLYISNYKESNFNDNINIDNFIDINVQDIQNKSDSTKPNAILGNKTLSYSETKGYFDKTSTGLSISSAISKNYLNYTINNLGNASSTIATDESVAKFTLKWKDYANPDIAFITKIENKLYKSCIFGKDGFSILLPDDNTNNGSAQNALRPTGIYYCGTASDGASKLYKPLYNNDPLYHSENHPLYNLGFSFAFGSPNYESTTEYNNQIFNAYTLYHNYFAYNGEKYWASQNKGFTDKVKTRIKNTISTEIKNRSFFAKAYIVINLGSTKTCKIGYKDIMSSSKYAGSTMNFSALEWTDFNMSSITSKEDYIENSYKYYTDNDLILINPEYFDKNNIHENLKSDIIDWVYTILSTTIVGISTDKKPILNLSAYGESSEAQVTGIDIVFKKIDFTVDVTEVSDSDKEFEYTFDILMNSSEYKSLCLFDFNSSLVISNDSNSISQNPSLMPFSTYRTYIHFVDNRNIITNGIKLKDITTNGIENTNSNLVLSYKVNEVFMSKYKSFFISIKPIGNIIIEGFGYIKQGNTHILNFLELDALLYNINDNITIINNNGETITNNATYYSSGSSTPVLAFGNCGYVSWTEENDDNNYENTILYIKIFRDIENINTNNNNLIKASEFIPLTITDKETTIKDGYYGSWFCSITKPKFDLASSCYVSGRDIYKVNRTETYMNLVDFDNYINVQSSYIYNIRSNFNLNYLSLTEDITDSIFSIGSASSGNKQVAKVINSAILSYIYELKAMYKDFMNKTFSAYDENYKSQFDNTIRVSNVLSDETFNNSVFKFDSTDYYNIPTDRGIIVSLFAIGNTIYAHTKGSLYKFDANQTIMSTNEDIKLQESEPFDIGLSQVFDSQYGYGGIENKEAGCITFDSYFFYDNNSNHIFAYSGNNQVQLIDGSIYKLLKEINANSCRTLHDSINNRILFELYDTSTYFPINFTISYNYKSKSFVSFHDITLKKAFSTKNISYSYYKQFQTLFNNSFKIGNKLNAYFITYELYGNASNLSNITFDYYGNAFDGKELYKQKSPFVICVIVFPKQYVHETINNISYLGYEQNNVYTYDQAAINSEVGIAPTIVSWCRLNNQSIYPKNPVKELYIISDTCISTLITETIDDSVRPNPLLDYKGFKYDKGLWNTNYFRNANNVDNIYNYPNQPRNGEIPNSDNYSLIYGRFFILNFNLTKDFPVKFEEVFINSEKY